MTEENADETYTIIYAALKHPIRRKILRMLDKEKLTYTEMLNHLDLDTGHLNYDPQKLRGAFSQGCRWQVPFVRIRRSSYGAYEQG